MRHETHITPKDWGKIHAKAWRDPAFKQLLETDPTAAIRQYETEAGVKFGRMVSVPPRPDAAVPDNLLEHFVKVPHSCC